MSNREIAEKVLRDGVTLDGVIANTRVWKETLAQRIEAGLHEAERCCQVSDHRYDESLPPRAAMGGVRLA